MRTFLINHELSLSVVLSAVMGAAAPSHCRAAGVTIITHGLNGNVDDWIIPLADKIPSYPTFPGARFTCYEIYFTSAGGNLVPAYRRLGGDAPADTETGEILVKLDWSQLANNDYSTTEVAQKVAPKLLDPLFIPELNGHPLAALPLHLIGHSRGGSLVCELSRRLGLQGVWVDHVTTLDPHPLNNDGFLDFPYTVEDATAKTYENVLFADNYYQELNLVFYGERVPGTYFRELKDLDGGYDGIAASHSDVHLWYFGTIDWTTPTSNTEATLGNSERRDWYTPFEMRGTTAGFLYSRIGGGNRRSDAQPAGPGNGRIRNGLNQTWDFGAGVSNNRTAIPGNTGAWPNLIQLNVAGTNQVALNEPISLMFFHQSGSSAALQLDLQFFLDADSNPFNSNDAILGQLSAMGTGVDMVASGTVAFTPNPATTVPGIYRIYGRITDGTRARCLYASETITVTPSIEPPWLGMGGWSEGAFVVEVFAAPGQRVILEGSGDLQRWLSLATNTMTGSVWSYSDSISIDYPQRFYRAILQEP